MTERTTPSERQELRRVANIRFSNGQRGFGWASDSILNLLNGYDELAAEVADLRLVVKSFKNDDELAQTNARLSDEVEHLRGLLRDSVTAKKEAK